MLRKSTLGCLLVLGLLAGSLRAGDSQTIFVPDGWEGAYNFGYAPVLRVGDWVIVSGVPSGGPGTYEDQVRRMYERVGELLDSAGATFDDVVELTSFHKSPTDSDEFRQEFDRYMPIHREFLGEHRPAWSAVGTTALLSSTAAVELRVVAVVGSGAGRVVQRGERTQTAGPTNTTWSITEDLEVSQIAPDVWVHTTWAVLSGQRFPSNGLIVRDGDQAILVDTAWGEEPTAALLDWIETELGLAVQSVVITHFHEDRLGGSPVLAERGVAFYSTPLTRELASSGAIPLPEPTLQLEVGGTRSHGPVEIFYPGPAHTRDNVMAWVPQAKVLFGGCAVRPGNSQGMGNVADADVEEWPASIRRAQAEYPDVVIVVPAHGAPAGPELLEHTIALGEEHLRSQE